MTMCHALALFLLGFACDRAWSLSLDKQRRNVLIAIGGAAVTPSLAVYGKAHLFSANANELDEIRTTITGVQYRDDRIGQGPLVEKNDVVVMHLQGLRRDGSVIVDTRNNNNGQPLLHQMGSVIDFDVFGGDSSKRPVVTLGIEDGIRGMRYGGIRRMVVPAPLGYGHAGVSRYDAMRMGLLKPVPRDEMLRYQVELLRCMDPPSPMETVRESGFTAQICCTEPNYPCKTDTDPN